MLRRPLESTQYTSIRYTERLDELGLAPSVGSRGDAYDNAMTEAFVGTFKAELIDGRRLSGFEQAEREALAWIGFYNHERLHQELGDIPPAEFEALYASTTTTRPFGPAEAVQPAFQGALADLGGTAATR